MQHHHPVDKHTAARWKLISTAHWRRTTRERNTRNLAVNAGTHCLVFGAGAGGSINGYSYRISSDLQTYQVLIEITTWGEITFLVHTADLILEARGNLPEGELAHGYCNLHGNPIVRHLKADNCASINFISRKFCKRFAFGPVLQSRRQLPVQDPSGPRRATSIDS